MAKKKNTIPSGFEDVLGNIYGNAEEGSAVSNIDEILPPDTPLDDETEEEPPVNTEDGKETKDDTSVKVKDDDSEIPESVLNNIETEKPAETNDESEEDDTGVTEDSVVEAQQVGLLFDAIGQSLGWDMNDID